MKHAKQLLEIEIYRLEQYIKSGGIKDVRNEIKELKQELEMINKEVLENECNCGQPSCTFGCS